MNRPAPRGARLLLAAPLAALLASGAPAGEDGALQRQRPGQGPPEPYVPPQVQDPNARSGLERIEPGEGSQPPDFLPVPDRWRLAKDLGLVEERWFDPYGPNILKADRPLFGRDWFLSVGAISDTVVEPRSFPVPVAPVTGEPATLDLLGAGDQLLVNQNFILALVLYKGDTVFKPPDWEFRITPVFNVNYLEVEEERLVDIDPLEGRTRTDGFIGLQELFIDKHLRNVSSRYDFDSLRVGIQPFSSDFRGFLFQDNQLGVRLFGNRANNVWQYNLAWFRRVEKDTNSGLNDLSQRIRDDDVVVGNLYRQDFPRPGFTSQFTVVYNRNREGNDPTYFDDNDFQQRPASMGTQSGRDYDVTYVGYNGDGHMAGFNFTLSAYRAQGDQSASAFLDAPVDIKALFAAAEISKDYDWIRPRISLLYASGDEDPFDSVDEGFDAIFENPIFAGADTSYWIRQTVPNIGGGGVTLSGRNGVLPSLRSSKEQGQSNFANPGIKLVGVGADLDLLPELRVSFNANHLKFDDTTVLETLRAQAPIDREIGWDLSVATIWRPLMSQNVVARLSGAVLLPGDGFVQMYGDEVAYSVLANVVLSY